MSETAGTWIVVCGHLCLDIIPVFPSARRAGEWFRPGGLSLVDAPVISTGGAVSNVGLALHRLGLPVRLAGRIGKDPFGTLILERVSAQGAGLTDWIAAVQGEVSSYTVVINPPGIDRIFFHCPGANDTFQASQVPDEALRNAAVFHFGYPPLMEKVRSDGGAGLSGLFSRARSHGALTSLDMTLPDPESSAGRTDWNAYLTRVLPSVDFFVPSVEELLYMCDRPRFDALSAGPGGIVGSITLAEVAALCDRPLARGVSAVLVKLGERGAYLRTSGKGLEGRTGWAKRELYSPVFTVPKVAGTTGAGDSTIAGFLASIYRGLPPEDALTTAVAVGGCCVEAPDAVSGVRSWDDTSERVRAGWKRAQPSFSEPGWRPRGDGLWAGPHEAE